MSDVVSVYVTAANVDEARRLARVLLERRLVACANLFPVESAYWWQDRIESASETALLLKTRRENADAIAAAVRELSSYSVPCVTVWPIVAGNAAYLSWIRAETRPAP